MPEVNILKMALTQFNEIWHDLPKPLTEMIGGSPIYRNDEEVLPLQAAHTIAWLHRRYAADCNTTGILADWEPKQPYLKKLGRIPTPHTWYPYERLAEFFSRASKELAAGA